ncbi:MAG: hypothetical protein JWN38_850 [Candidatus Saccharibacteria bacterium]|nr:hypothetical protein [Candidatus Saccharibacteria bacterium]
MHEQIITIAVEGIDGSGKTSVVEALAEQLEAEGLHVATYAPYRITNERLGSDVYKLWQSPDTASQAITEVQQTFAECETLAAEEGADVIIYDRHWMTALTEIRDQPELVEQWGDCYVPAALLLAKPEVATARQQGDKAEDWAQLESQRHYDAAYRQLVAEHFRDMLGIYRSDVDVSPEAIARNINWDLRIRR